MKPKVIIICGPTGSGKSSLAISLAKLLNTEIISADSLAIYKSLDIGTAKPTKDELSKVKHHMIDVVEPFDNFSVSDYEEMALPIVNEVIANGKIPIICGGTGFYINSILYKLGYGGSEGNLEIREKYLEIAKNQGVHVVYEELRKIDPKSCETIHENDVVRVVRALEIYYSTGKKKSEQNDLLEPRFSYLALTPNVDRETLYNRINLRVDKMLELGLIDEVKGLIESGIDKNCQCMQGIGYKETYDAIVNNDYSGLADLIKINSRHYAKRQVTFFKKLPNVVKVDVNDEKIVDNLVKQIVGD